MPVASSGHLPMMHASRDSDARGRGQGIRRHSGVHLVVAQVTRAEGFSRQRRKNHSHSPEPLTQPLCEWFWPLADGGTLAFLGSVE